MNCLDEGLLQALNDGELSAESRREAEAHLASCTACAAAAEDAAREFAFFSQAFAVEEPLNVPAERLRANIAAAVAEVRPAPVFDGAAAHEPSGRRRSLWSSLAAAFAPRQVAVFAGLALAAVVLAATFFALKPGTQVGKDEPRQIAEGNGPMPRPSTDATVAQPPASPVVVEEGGQGESGGAAGEQIVKNLPGPIRPKSDKSMPKGGTPQKIRPMSPPTGDRSSTLAAVPHRPKTPQPDLLPVERAFVREIAALKGSIERQKLQTLSPTLRAEYERNVAVVDEAIASTREAVKSNPQDRDAQEFLRAAYQDKIDMLSAFAGKSQLASADR